MKIKFLGVLILVFVFLSCQREESKPISLDVTLKIVHTGETKNFFDAVNADFASRQALSTVPFRVKFESIFESDATAARKIARGEIKANLWLTSDVVWSELVNQNIKNLGAKQIECVPLFSSPMVIATQERFVNIFQAEKQIFSWNEFFQSMMLQVNEQRTIESLFAYSIGTVNSTVSGFSGIIQLALFALHEENQELTAEIAKGQDFQKKLVEFLFPISYFSISDDLLLERSLVPTTTRMVFSLVTEQQLIDFNIRKGGANPALVALYPKEGSYWLKYHLCRSQADWVSSNEEMLAKKFQNYLKEPFAQGEAYRRGFRPKEIKVEKTQDPFSAKFGVLFDVNGETKVKIQPQVLEYLEHGAENFGRPVSRTIVLDTSGTTGSGSLYAGQKLANILLATIKERDVASIVTFADKVSSLALKSSDKAMLIKKLEGLQGVGGSAIYDAMGVALNLNTREDLRRYRKEIYFVTDGKDNKSLMSLSDITELWKDSRRNFDISLHIIFVQTGQVDASDLESITKAADGKLYKTYVADIDRTIQEVTNGS